MCLVIATTFTITWLPFQLDQLVLIYGNRDDAVLVLDALETIAYLNSCVNPVVYALMWRPFRLAFIQVMRRTHNDDECHCFHCFLCVHLLTSVFEGDLTTTPCREKRDQKCVFFAVGYLFHKTRAILVKSGR